MKRSEVKAKSVASGGGLRKIKCFLGSLDWSRDINPCFDQMSF